jgi:hypothetical protein
MPTNNEALIEGQPGDWFAGLARRRSAARTSANWRWLLSAGILLPGLALLWFTAALSGKLITILAVAGLIMAGIWGYQPIADANKSAARHGQAVTGDSFGLAYRGEVEAGTEFAAARRFGLVPDYMRATFGHHWFGQLKGHDVSIYDAHLETKRGSGKSQQWNTAFRGAIVRMEFGDDVGATTLLQRAGAHRTLLGLGASRDSINPDGHRLDRVDQIDPEFAEVFSVFSDDAGAARAVVKPAYVARLLELESALGAQELRALFTQRTLIIAVEGGSFSATGHPAAFSALSGLAEAINRAGRVKVASVAPQSAPEQ